MITRYTHRHRGLWLVWRLAGKKQIVLIGFRHPLALHLDRSLGAKCGLGGNDPVLALPLGLVERLVGALEHRLG